MNAQRREEPAFGAIWSALHADPADAGASLQTHQPAPDLDQGRTEALLARLPRLVRAPEDEGASALEPREVLGRGGMGVVRRARQLALLRDVAVKTPRGDASALATVRLLHEGLVTGALEHPNVVPIHLLGRDVDGGPMLVMKEVAGDSWTSVLRDPHHRALREAGDPLRFHLGVLLQVANALHFAHEKGVVHRDVKPDNVMIGRFGEVYLLDWGLAVVDEEVRPPEWPASTSPAGLAGTPAYLAPEMLVPDRLPVDERSDVFLLGATLHELLVGRPPHLRDTLQATLLAAWEAVPPVFPESVPAGLAAICRKALARNPLERHQTALAFKREITEFLEHRESVLLAQEARAKTDELLQALAREQVDREQLPRLLGEARFGFRQALRIWPGNEQARAGLQRALEAMAGWQLDRGEPEAAALLVDELPERRPALSARLELERGRVERQRRAAARLQKLRREYDLSVGTGLRALVVSIMAVFWLVFYLVQSASPGNPFFAARQQAGGALVFLGLSVVVVLLARRTLFQNRVNRAMVGCLLVMSSLTLAVPFMGRVFDLPDPSLAATTLLLMAMAIGIMAMTLDVRLLAPAAVYVAAALVTMLAPQHSASLLPGSHVAALTLMALAWRPRAATRDDA